MKINMSHMSAFCVGLMTLIASLTPSIAHAYVDPGFFSSIYQFVYVILFGFAASLVFKPWTYIKTKFFGKKEEDDKKTDDTSAD